MQLRIEQSLQRANTELARGDNNEAAVSFSTAARKCMDRARIGDWETAIKWLERSIGPRQTAIELYRQVGRPIDVARDHSFLGKAFSRLGVMKNEHGLLACALLERTMAMVLFRKLNLVGQQAKELSYLAEDFRARGWQETEPKLRRDFYLKSVGYSERALALYPRFFMGEELAARKLQEEGFIAQAKGYAALCERDREEVRKARNLCRSLADRLAKSGSDYQSQRLIELAKYLDKYWFFLIFGASP
ncbi:MAG: hypothetical protein WC645_01335 [Candidatus Margulisiibacteriota bacterium]